MSVNEQMFQEAKDAFHDRDYKRCKDLLSRLIRNDPQQAEYWLWLSAAVGNKKERTFCLKKALEIDPAYLPAKQGLAYSGEQIADDEMHIPLEMQTQNWTLALKEEKGSQQKRTPSKARLQLGWLAPILGAFGVITIALLMLLNPGKTRQVLTWLGGPTHTPSALPTLLPTAQPWSGLAATITQGPDPLWKSLSATYTPTAMYIDTPHPRSEAYRSGIFAYQRQEWDKVILYMQQALSIDPDAPDLTYYLALAYAEQGQTSKAMGLFDDLIKDHPDFAPAYTGKAMILMEQKPVKYDVSKTLLTSAINRDPAYTASYFELAALKLALNDPESALATLQDAEPYTQNNYQLSFLSAQAYLQMDELDKALASIQAAIEVDQTAIEAYRLLGQIYMLRGEYALAREPLEISATYLTQDAAVYAWLGTIYADSGSLESALSAFDKAEQIDDTIAEVYYQKGAAYFQMEQYERAQTNLEKGFALDKSSFEGNILLGRTYLMLDVPGKAYQQFSVAEAFASSNTDWATIYYWRAKSYDDLGEIKLALRERKWLLALPLETAYAPYWNDTRALLDTIFTPTSTPVTPSITSTRMPTRTLKPTSTRLPTLTQTPTPGPIFTP
jgi:tetratricopeptide (TPR) repeat protein